MPISQQVASSILAVVIRLLVFAALKISKLLLHFSKSFDRGHFPRAPFLRSFVFGLFFYLLETRLLVIFWQANLHKTKLLGFSSKLPETKICCERSKCK